MLTQDLLKELFNYNQDTGELTWKVRSAYNVQPGAEAGSVSGQGYREVQIAGRTHKCHRLIWMMTYGNFPSTTDIDHINGDRADNRLTNLRLASRKQNPANRKVPANSSSGFKGVAPHGKGFRAYLTVNGSRINLGTRSSAKEAADLYDASAIEHYGVFARTNKMMGLL